MFEKLPDEHKQDTLFSLWRYEERNGPVKPAKNPYHLGGQRASGTDRAHLCSFEKAAGEVADIRYSGIGLGKSDGSVSLISVTATMTESFLRCQRICSMTSPDIISIVRCQDWR